MRKLIFTLMLLISVGTFAQTAKTVTPSKSTKYEQRIDSLLARVDTLLQINNELLDQLDVNTSLKGRYKLYQTENLYTLLRLDTKTGKIEQVQWSLEDNQEGTFTINDSNLNFGDGYGSGTFELYPTKNMYQFILIDKTDGRMWHVQWGLDNKKRWIRRIY